MMATLASAAAPLLAAAAVLLATPSKVGVRRLHALAERVGGYGRSPSPARSPSRRPAWHRVAVVGTAVLCALSIGGPLGVALALPAAIAAAALLRRVEPPAARAARERTAAELATVADLVGACLECGAAPIDAVEVTARALGGPWPALLLPPVAALRLGADPRTCWSALAASPDTAPLARILARALDDGVSLVPLLRALALDRRRDRRSRARASAQRAGVLALGPLGACFLPAFVLIGVVPVVVSVGRTVLGGLT